jgi:hypothetical protein
MAANSRIENINLSERLPASTWRAANSARRLVRHLPALVSLPRAERRSRSSRDLRTQGAGGNRVLLVGVRNSWDVGQWVLNGTQSGTQTLLSTEPRALLARKT